MSKLPQDKNTRKQMPMATGVLDYFPLALAEVARVSQVGNEQHNPGQPMHWNRGKSGDHPDCLLRHLAERGTDDDDGLSHSGKVAWRALAILQLEQEAKLDTVLTEANSGVDVRGEETISPSAEMKKTRKTCYIAGPMRGKNQYNFPEFLVAQEHMERLGWLVFNPARLDMENGIDPIADEAGVRKMLTEFTRDDWDMVITRDIAHIMALDPLTDVLVYLPGSGESVGASAEIALAKWRNVVCRPLSYYT